MKKTRVILSPEAGEAYDRLLKGESKHERMILKSVNHKTELLKLDFQAGNPIAKHLIPREYVIKYGATNLFRFELAASWRMVYTAVDGENDAEVIAFVLDIIDHPTYDEKFGYAKK
ncbi:hypothetical protein H0O03_04715 [Candidatus Micrarchaeota archaeon]|nr:hypothetical protein [Candidatus Micrarchaeota archaeon]